MSVKRIIALIFIYLAAAGGWLILGTVTAVRSSSSGASLGPRVEALWGTELVETAPALTAAGPDDAKPGPVMPAAADLKAQITLDYRRKGLVWYPTYVCRFDGAYTLTNPGATAQTVRLHYGFPAPEGTYDAFSMQLDGQPLGALINTREGVDETVALAPGQTRTFRVTHVTRGMGAWRYRIDPRLGRARNLRLEVSTDFADIDYPEGSLSAMRAEPAGRGRQITWEAADLITHQDFGVVVPERLNPGPLAARITFFAPVCLIFFFVLVITINLVGRVNIHPMHYLFVAAGFFAFHVLLAYLVDVVNIHAAFWIATAASMLLVNLYLRGALGRAYPWQASAAAQVFFLVLFSYSFFLKGMTGLTVAVGSVVTLAVLMLVTARVDWNAVFTTTTESQIQSPR